jgi:superfamily II RNA helicase
MEAPLAEKDEALMENTEGMLREQLRQLIQNRVPAEQLQQHIGKINSNLDKAEQLLGEG